MDKDNWKATVDRVTRKFLDDRDRTCEEYTPCLWIRIDPTSVDTKDKRVLPDFVEKISIFNFFAVARFGPVLQAIPLNLLSLFPLSISAISYSVALQRTEFAQLGAAE